MARKLRYVVKVGSPCTEDWSRMAGAGRERYCAACERHVHDFAALTTGEIERLIAESSGRLCGRLTHTADGRLVTADLVAIDSGWKGISFRAPALAGAALTAALGLASGAAAQSSASPTEITAPSQKSDNGCPAPQTAPTPEQAVQATASATTRPKFSFEIVDSVGSPLPGAKVTLVAKGTCDITEFVSNSSGWVDLHSIPHGSYDIHVNERGFSDFYASQVQLPASRTIELQVGMVTGGEIVIEDRNPFHRAYRKVRSWL